MLKLLSFAFTLSFLIAGVVLGILNPHAVTLELFWSSPKLPLSVVMAAVFILGLLVGALVIFVQAMRLRWRLSQQQRENKKLAAQIVQLRKAEVNAANNTLTQSH
jgi:putative membrane protein